MKFIDDARSKYDQFDTSGKFITIIAITSVIGWIVARFLPPLYEQFVLPSRIVPALLQPWSYISYAFLHAGLFHLIGNALGLFYSGRFFLNIFNKRQYLSLFFMGVLAGGFVFTLATELMPGYFSAPGVIGASAGVFALIIFCCTYFAESEIRLIFFNIKLKYLGFFFAAMNLFGLFTKMDAGSSLGHLAGMAVGYYAAVRMRDGIDMLEGTAKLGDFFSNFFTSSSSTKAKKTTARPKSTSRMKTVFKNKSTTSKTTNSRAAAPNQAEIDSILDKISANGYDSLSKAEKDTLFKAGKD
jgi:membrane associated rhomboid family serine protease